MAGDVRPGYPHGTTQQVVNLAAVADLGTRHLCREPEDPTMDEQAITEHVREVDPRDRVAGRG
jgi:hypothetical protein